MNRISDRMVELTPDELIVCDFFERLLDRGYNIPKAVSTLRIIAEGRDVSEDFWAYLGQ